MRFVGEWADGKIATQGKLMAVSGGGEGGERWTGRKLGAPGGGGGVGRGMYTDKYIERHGGGEVSEAVSDLVLLCFAPLIFVSCGSYIEGRPHHLLISGGPNISVYNMAIFRSFDLVACRIISSSSTLKSQENLTVSTTANR